MTRRTVATHTGIGHRPWPLLLAAGLASLANAAAWATPGALDPDFGSDGRLLVDFGYDNTSINAIGHLSGGRIVLAGSTGDDNREDACGVTVLLPDGTPDPAFGNAGQVVLDRNPGFTNSCDALAVQPDGRIVLAGRWTNQIGRTEFMIIRLLGDGSLDTSFSDDGYVFASFAPVLNPISSPQALALQPDGKIVVAGRFRPAPVIGPIHSDMAVLRLNADGSTDAGFGSGGRVTIGIDAAGPTFEEAYDVAIQPDGRIVLIGLSQGTHFRMMVARLTAAGQPDTSFNLVGHRLLDFPGLVTSIGHSVLVRADGTLLLAGIAGDASGEAPVMAVAALQPNGQNEIGFGSGGRVLVDLSTGAGAVTAAFAMVEDSDGRLVLGGVTGNDANDGDMAVVRLHADGGLDTDFGISGAVLVPFNLMASGAGTDLARAVHLLPDGDIVVAGRATLSGPPYALVGAVARLSGGDDNDALFVNGFEASP